jgi:hypothetical protein
MRRVLCSGLAAIVLGSACRNEDIAPPELRRPLEGLPAGAQVCVLASDLRNTWKHVEVLELGAAMERLPALACVWSDSEFVRLRAVYRDFEARTGTDLEDDLLLNVLGGRVALGLYPPADSSRSREPDLLLVAELEDAARFRDAVTRVRQATAGSWRIEDVEFDGKPALALEGPEGRDLVVVQRDRLLLATTREDLLQQAVAVRSGSGAPAALAEAAFAAALGEVGAHNVVTLVRQPARPDRWIAQAFTWDRAGLHLDHRIVTPPPRRRDSEPKRRDQLLRSVPDGMTLAFYLHAAHLDPRSLLGVFHPRAESAGDTAAADTAAVRRSVIPALPFLPLAAGDLAAWAGDEVAVALAGMQATALAPVPDVGFVVEVRDPDAAERALRAVEERLGRLPVGPTARGFEDATYGGKTYRTTVHSLSENVAPCWLLDGDVAVVTTTRALMQQIIDTRRTGKRSLVGDASFRRFAKFVPAEACAVAYADQRRLHRAAEQLGASSHLWGEEVERSVRQVEELAGLLEHFPAGAAYASRDADRLVVRGWMLED